MLFHLSIKNFAVVKQLELNLEQGLTAITGETGAGKSIAIDALNLCMGGRADATVVRSGAEKSEIVAHFAISNNLQATQWLNEHEMQSEDEPDVCFIRRVISKEGRSRAFINGTTASLQQLKDLGAKLLSIHGQNTHLSLIKESVQRSILDNFADHGKLQDQVKADYLIWQEKKALLVRLNEDKQQRSDRQQLLSYQVKELDEFALQDNEFAELEAEHKRLSHHQNLVEESQRSLNALYEADQHAALSVLQQHADSLAAMTEHDENLASTVNLLQESAAQLEEAVHELRHYADSLESDPERLNYVEDRFSQAISLARKHNVAPEDLAELHAELDKELQQIDTDEQRLEDLLSEVQSAEMQYKYAAQKLSKSRQNAAKSFTKSVLEYVKQMNMPHAKLILDVEYHEEAAPSPTGMDKISLLASINPGQAAGKIDKVVSGGELSRIGLAVQVVGLSKDAPPTLIFDEVDTGISGPTASIVGQLLRQLGRSLQVMCVTHLPQVAAQAHNQLFVSKAANRKQTETHVLPLTPQDRVHELARLLAGDTVTESAIANAKELLEQVEMA